jgi:putative transcriptional regulator
MGLAIDGHAFPYRKTDRQEKIPVKNRVRELREQRGLSQAEFGEKIGVSRQTVYAIEVGKYDPSLPLAFKIAKQFGCRIEDIFDPKG